MVTDYPSKFVVLQSLPSWLISTWSNLEIYRICNEKPKVLYDLLAIILYKETKN